MCFKYHEGFTGHIVWDNLSLFWLHSIPNFGLRTFRPLQVSSLQYRHDLSLKWSSQMWKTDCRKHLPNTVTPMQIWVWGNILWNIEGRLPGLIIIILTHKSDYPSTTLERRLPKAHTFNNFCQRACKTWLPGCIPGTRTSCQRWYPRAGQTEYINSLLPLMALQVPSLGPWKIKKVETLIRKCS